MSKVIEHKAIFDWRQEFSDTIDANNTSPGDS